MIHVHNKRTFSGDGIYIGRPSLLGNPYTYISAYHTLAEFIVKNRQDAIEKYKTYFLEKMLHDWRFRTAIQMLQKRHASGRDIHLVCWCHPLPCHGDIIKEYIETGKIEIITQGKLEGFD